MRPLTNDPVIDSFIEEVFPGIHYSLRIFESYGLDESCVIKTDHYHIDIHSFNKCLYLVCIDARRVYNKTSQSPICFNIPMRPRAIRRLKNKLLYLLTKEGLRNSLQMNFHAFSEEFHNMNRYWYYGEVSYARNHTKQFKV